MPGGVPARIGAHGAEMVLPEGLSYEDALRINMDGLELSGYTEMLEDGTVILTDEEKEKLSKLGLDYPSMSVLKAVEIEEESIQRLKQFMVEHGINTE